MNSNQIREAEERKGLIRVIPPSPWIPVQFCSISAHLSCHADLSGHWKPMVHCVNVTCFVLCDTDEVKTTDLTLIVKVTLC